MKVFSEILFALLSFFAIVFLLVGAYFIYSTDLSVEYKVAIGLSSLFFASLSEGVALIIYKVWP